MLLTRVARCALLAWLPLFALAASAQTGHGGSRDGQAASSEVPYQSVFSDYKSFQDPDLASWRAANEQVAQTSGNDGHDMVNMTDASKGGGMTGMPGHGTGSEKKEDAKASQPVHGKAVEGNKVVAEMRNMTGMNHGDMEHMHHNMPSEKGTQ